MRLILKVNTSKLIEVSTFHEFFPRVNGVELPLRTRLTSVCRFIFDSLKPFDGGS